MPIPSIKYDLNLGLNNAKATNDLSSGQLVEATGIYYRKGSDEAYLKIGRTAFSSQVLGTGDGLVYAEFTDATPQIFARADTLFVRADANALTGTFTTLTSALQPGALGLWSTFHTNKYFFDDGVNPPWVIQYIAVPPSDTADYLYRPASLLPPTTQPVLTINATGDAQITLTSATPTTTGDKPYSNINNAVDGNRDTFANVSITNAGVTSVLKLIGFTGTGSGVREDWVLSLTYETSLINAGSQSCKTTIDYTLDGGSNWTNFETVKGSVTKKTVTFPVIGSYNSSALGWRITSKKLVDTGRNDWRVYDARLFNPDGVGNPLNDLTTGVYYWVTERIDYLGIESVSGPVSELSGPCTDAASIRVSLPAAPVNTLTTHYNLYRSVDGGSFPVGTLVDSYKVGTVYAYDDGPLNQIAGTQTYGAFTVAGIYYHRDVQMPISTVMTTYQNSVVVAPVAFPNQLRYSVADFPESFPTINVIKMGSNRDDTVRALIPLSSQLGVFMAGRGRRIDHLPTSSDPTFGVDPEDFAPDHGIESRNGWCYMTPPSGVHSHIAYVARDGIRITDLYTSTLITTNIRWDVTVDLSTLQDSHLRNNPSNDRLEFYGATPTEAFREEMGWPPGTKLSMWLHYQMTDNYQPTSMRASFHPCNVDAVDAVPLDGNDYMFMMSDGIKLPAGQVFVDEVGSNDATNSYNTSGTVQRRITTGQLYADPSSRLTRNNLERLVVDSDPLDVTLAVTVTSGRDDTGASWSVTRNYDNSLGGAKPLWYNISGQWHQIGLDASTADASTGRVRNFSWSISDYGEFR